jgi:hypothetical protein
MRSRSVQCGQVYSAPSPRGRRYVRVVRVWRKRGWVDLVECTRRGGALRRSRDGLPPDLVFSSTLEALPRSFRLEAA